MRRIASIGVVATSIIALCAPAFAQATAAPQATAQSGPAESQGDVQDGGLQEIIVTAQRREETAQKAALAISVVQGEELSSRQVTDTSQLNQLVPAVTAQSQGGAGTVYFVRGVGNLSTSGYVEPAVAVNYDGVYIGRDSATQGLLYDIDRIEALKGPQGTLYGRNATGGAINMIPAHPRYGQTSGAITASYGNYDSLIVDGHLNLGLGDNAAIRVSGLRSKHDGYLNDGTSDQDLTAGRIQLGVELSDDFSIRLAADFAHIGGTGAGATYANRYAYNFATQSFGVTPTNFDDNIGLYDPRAQAFRSSLFFGLSGRNAEPLVFRPRNDNDLYGFNAEITFNTPVGTLSVIPAYRIAKIDQLFNNLGWPIHWKDDQEFTTLEVRLAGDRAGGFLDYILGAYLYHDDLAFDWDISQQASASFQNTKSSATAKALYARLTGHLTGSFRITGGIRYTHERKSFDGRNNFVAVACQVRVAGVPSCPTAPLIPLVGDISQVGFAVPPGSGAIPIGTTGALAARRDIIVDSSKTFDKVNFRVAAEFDVAPQSLLYASFENGFRAGGFQLAPGFETYDPEFIDAYTIGMKNRFFNNRMQLNIEAFLWKYRDQQLSHAGFDATGNQSFYTENVGRSTNKGFEVEAQVIPVHNTLLNATVQYLHAQYDSFVYTVASVGTPPFTGCPFTPGTVANSFTINCSGRQAFQAPKWTINVGAQQKFEFGGTDVTARVYTQYRSGRWVGYNYLPFEYVKPTWTTGAQLSVEPEGTPLTITAFVENIENNRFPTLSFSFAAASSTLYNLAAPRTYGLRVSGKF